VVAPDRAERNNVLGDDRTAADEGIRRSGRTGARAEPAMNTKSPTRTCPARWLIGEGHAVADMQRGPRGRRSVEPVRPTRVDPPPSTVPVCMVTCSRITLREPITRRSARPCAPHAAAARPDRRRDAGAGLADLGMAVSTTCEISRVPHGPSRLARCRIGAEPRHRRPGWPGR